MLNCKHHITKTVIRKVILRNYAGKAEAVQVSTKLCSMCGHQLGVKSS